MPLYSYRAINSDGIEITGTTEAISEFDVNEILDSRNLIPIDIEVQEKVSFSFSRRLPPNNSDRCLILRQMAMMLRAGITLPSIIPKIRENNTKQYIRDALSEITGDLQSGSTLSSAMRKQPKLFSPIVCGVVESSETSGSLDEAFEKMARAIEYWAKVKNKVIESLIYPVIVLLVAIGVSYVMFFSFIPKLERFLAGSGKPLPSFTQLIFGFAEWLRESSLLIILVIFIFSIGLFFAYRNQKGRRFIELFAINLPIFGNALKYSELSVLSSSLGNLVNSGSSLISSLDLVEGSLKTSIYRQWVQVTRNKLLTGESLGDTLDPGLIPLPAIAVIKAGETSGSLGMAFDELDEYFSNRLQALVGLIVSLVEPALLIFVGAIVGSVYFAMFMAIVSLNSA